MTVAEAPRVLVITPEPVSGRMAGPAIRALELSRALARDPRLGAVTLVSLSVADRADESVRVVAAQDAGALRALVDSVDSVVVQGDVLGLHPWLVDHDVVLVVDAYDPYHLEQLEQARPLGERARRAVVRDCVTSLNVQFARADLVLCASPRQRDLWTGHLAALGRINPVTYDPAHDLSGLIAVVPFGVTHADAPPRDRGVLHAHFPLIAAEDVVLLWGGGIYDWFDPVVLVRAVAAAARRVPSLRLVFMGTRHPVAGRTNATEEAIQVAQELRVLDTHVFFHDGWVPYDERGRWFSAADIGVSTHHDHVETRYAFRTRLLDYLWSHLPVVTTGGDDLGAEMERRRVAEVVPAEDVVALTRVLERVGLDGAWRKQAAIAAAAMALDYAWDQVAKPLVDFCASPLRAPDLAMDEVDRRQLGLGDHGGGLRAGLMLRARAAVREGGWGLVVRRVRGRLHRMPPAPRRG